MIEENRRVIHSCNKTEFKKIAQMVDFIKPNEHEAVTITGEKDPLVALRRLDELGPAISIVTLAERGSLLSQGGKMYHVPAFSTQAIDPTGAGDVYAGSFITEYRRTGSPVEAALFASAAASLMVEQVGPDFRMASESVKRRKEAIRDQLITETFGQ